MKGGRGFVSGMAMPGETFGAEGLAPRGVYVTDAKAADGVETLHLGGEQFRAFLREQPAHAISLIGQIMAERSTLLERLQELASLNVEDRLVSILLRLSEDTGFMVDDTTLRLNPAHHRLLCEMVGATREVGRDTTLQRRPASLNGGPRRAARPFHHLRRPGKSDCPLLRGRQPSG